MGDYNEFTGARSRAWPSVISASGHEITTVFFRINYDQDSRSRFILIYVPKNDRMASVLRAVAEGIPKYLTFDAETLIRSFTMKVQGESEPESFTSYPFSGRAYVYYEGDVLIEDLGNLTTFYRRRNISVEFLGNDYANGVWSNIRLGMVAPLPKYSITNGNIEAPITRAQAAQATHRPDAGAHRRPAHLRAQEGAMPSRSGARCSVDALKLTIGQMSIEPARLPLVLLVSRLVRLLLKPAFRGVLPDPRRPVTKSVHAPGVTSELTAQLLCLALLPVAADSRIRSPFGETQSIHRTDQRFLSAIRSPVMNTYSARGASGYLGATNEELPVVCRRGS